MLSRPARSTGSSVAAVVVRRDPGEVDLRGCGRGGNQPGGRVGHGRVGGGARDARRAAQADPVDRRDAVVARGGRLEAGVRVRGARAARVGRQVLPGGAPVVRDLDTVTGDLRAAIVGGWLPGEVDLRGAVRLRGEVLGHARKGRLGGRLRDVGERPVARDVDRGDAVVPRGRGFEVHVGECRRRRVGVAADDAPGPALVAGGLDPVAADRGAAGVSGRSPRQVDPRRADRPGRQPGRCRGNVGMREGRRLERPLAGSHAVDCRHLVSVEGCRLEVDVREGGRPRTRVGTDRDPVAVVGAEPPDRVAGDPGPAVAGRRLPGEGDARGSARPRAQALGRVGARGVGGASDHVRVCPLPLGVDRGHAIEPGRAGGETGVQVGGGRAAGAGHQDDPPGDAVGGRFDPVAGDRVPAVRGRARPGEEELVASPHTARHHPEARGRARSGDIGGRLGDARPRAPARPGDRRDPVMAGAAGAEAAVGVSGGSGIGVGLEHQPPAGSGAGHLDAVAGDRRRAAGGGGGPAQLDGGRPPGPGRHSPGRVRQEVLRRGAGDVGGFARPVEVDRGDPVVARVARVEARVAVAGVGAPGIPRQIPPRVPAVRRHLDQVPGDLGAAIRERGVPLQFDRRGTVVERREVARRAGDPGLRLSGDVSHRHIEAERAIADQIPERVGPGVAVEHSNRVVGEDWLGQGQEQLARDHFGLGHGPDVEHTVPEEGNGKVVDRRGDVVIEVFTEDDDDIAAVDLRLAHFRGLIVHVEGERPPDVPLLAAVLRDVRRDADDHRAFIILVRSQVEGISRAGAVQGGNLIGTDDHDVVDLEAGHALRETDVDADFFLYVSGPGT